MSHLNTIVRRRESAEDEVWIPTTLDALGKNEDYLEETIAASPSLLRLESRRTGVRRPFMRFRQLEFTTPQGRGIRPDIVMLAASGHVIVVEVKLASNPELRDRRVIAQIVDYAASFAALSEEEIVELFGRESDADVSWSQLVENLFPAEADVEDLAQALMDRIQSGQLNLVIACDKEPTGLPELVKGVASQAAVEFDLDLVVVEPYVRDLGDATEILFVPRPRLSTEIVGRTVVTISYHEGDAKPGVAVKTATVDEIEQNMRQAQATGRQGKTWTDEEIRDAFENSDNQTVRGLFAFTLECSADGRLTAPGVKIRPSFGLYLKGKDSEGGECSYQVLMYTGGAECVRIYPGTVEFMATTAVHSDFVQRLGDLFGECIDLNKKEPRVLLEDVSEHLEELKDLIRWAQDNVRS